MRSNSLPLAGASTSGWISKKRRASRGLEMLSQMARTVLNCSKVRTSLLYQDSSLIKSYHSLVGRLSNHRLVTFILPGDTSESSQSCVWQQTPDITYTH